MTHARPIEVGDKLDGGIGPCEVTHVTDKTVIFINRFGYSGVINHKAARYYRSEAANNQPTLFED